jgi:hypothetical protein
MEKGYVVQGEVYAEPVLEAEVVTAEPIMGEVVGEVVPSATDHLPEALDGAPRLALVAVGSADALRFDHADVLRAGGEAPLSANGKHVGLYWPQPRNAWGHWDYIDLGCSDRVRPQRVKLEGPFIIWYSREHGEFAFDVSMWQLHEGQHLVAVKACAGNPGGPTRMSKDAAGRDFVLHADGTIGPRTAQHLRLGRFVPKPPAPCGPGWSAHQNIDMCGQGDVEIIHNWRATHSIEDLQRIVEQKGYSAVCVGNFGHAALKQFPYQLTAGHCKPSQGYTNTLYIWNGGGSGKVAPATDTGIDGTYDGDGLRYVITATADPSVVKAKVAGFSFEMRKNSHTAWDGVLPPHVPGLGGAPIHWEFEPGLGAFTSKAPGEPTRRFVRSGGGSGKMAPDSRPTNGSIAKLALSSPPGKGLVPKFHGRHSGPDHTGRVGRTWILWSLESGSASGAAELVVEGPLENCRLRWKEQNLCLEVCCRKMEEGRNIWLWNDDPPVPAGSHSTFALNDDGSISPSRQCPGSNGGDPSRFALGLRGSRCVLVSRDDSSRLIFGWGMSYGVTAEINLENELTTNQWSAGKPGGGPEAFAANPWRFNADHTFVTERDGCHGTWFVSGDKRSLRMDWQGGQRGNYAEFLRRPGFPPTCDNVGSSYGFMRSWSLTLRGGSGGGGYEENWARIWCPIAGHPDMDQGAYHEPIGLCCYTTRRYEHDRPDDEIICNLILGLPLVTALWIGTLCYQPCGCICAHQVPWLGDCPCSEQRVTKHFVEKYPHLVTKGPARMER